MDSSAAISSAVAGLGAGGAAASISASLLRSTEAAEAQQVATLFSSIGIGGHVDSSA